MFQSTFLSLDEWINLEVGNKEFSMLKNGFQLPTDIHLMTVENWDGPDTDETAETFDVLLRFENLYDITEVSFGTFVHIPSDMFVGLDILDMVELSLGGDRPVEKVEKRFKWTKNKVDVSISSAMHSLKVQIIICM